MTVINRDAFDALQNRMGDKFPTLLAGFLKNAIQYLEAIQTGLNEQDLDAIIHGAHSLKSSSGLLGLVQIHDSAEILEYKAKDLSAVNDNNVQDLVPLYETLNSNFSNAQKELEG